MSDFLTEEEAAQLLQGSCPELEAGYQFTKKQIAELEGLRNKVAEQAAVIGRLREELYLMYLEEYDSETALEIVERDFPTDSQQILAEYRNEVLEEAAKLRIDALEIFSNDSEVRDVIEWYDASIRAMKDDGYR